MLLEEMGYVLVQGEDGGKKFYIFSVEGKVYLEEKENVELLQQVLCKFELCCQECFDVDLFELWCVVQNFCMVLYMCLVKGKLVKEELYVIIDIIDCVVVVVECV